MSDISQQLAKRLTQTGKWRKDMTASEEYDGKKWSHCRRDFITESIEARKTLGNICKLLKTDPEHVITKVKELLAKIQVLKCGIMTKEETLARSIEAFYTEEDS